MKQILIIITVLLSITMPAQKVTDNSFVYDPGTYKRNPVRYPSIKHNPWIDLDSMTIEDIQDKIIDLLAGAFIYKSYSKPIIPSFGNKNKPQLLYLNYDTDLLNPVKHMLDLRKIQEFQAISTKAQDIHILNIMMYRVDYKKAVENKKVKHIKFKFTPQIEDYNDARILMLLLIRYNELLKEMYPEYTGPTINP